MGLEMRVKRAILRELVAVQLWAEGGLIWGRWAAGSVYRRGKADKAEAGQGL